MKAWNIIDRGSVPTDAQELEFTCQRCGLDALLPHTGRVIAQLQGGGVIFDGPRGTLPTEVRCPHCGSGFELEPRVEQEAPHVR